jgi:hypothetical protein
MVWERLGVIWKDFPRLGRFGMVWEDIYMVFNDFSREVCRDYWIEGLFAIRGRVPVHHFFSRSLHSSTGRRLFAVIGFFKKLQASA